MLAPYTGIAADTIDTLHNTVTVVPASAMEKAHHQQLCRLPAQTNRRLLLSRSLTHATDGGRLRVEHSAAGTLPHVLHHAVLRPGSATHHTPTAAACVDGRTHRAGPRALCLDGLHQLLYVRRSGGRVKQYQRRLERHVRSLPSDSELGRQRQSARALPQNLTAHHARQPSVDVHVQHSVLVPGRPH